MASQKLLQFLILMTLPHNHKILYTLLWISTLPLQENWCIELISAANVTTTIVNQVLQVTTVIQALNCKQYEQERAVYQTTRTLVNVLRNYTITN